MTATWHARGNALRASGRLSEAAEAFSCAAALAPASAEAQNDHGRALHEARDLIGAAEAYRRALALAPGLWQPRLNLAALALEVGRFAEAAAGFKAVLGLKPGDVGALAGLVHARQHACDWHSLAAQRDNLLARVAAGAAVPPFLAVAAGCPDEAQRAGAAAWAAVVAPRRRPRPPAKRRDGEPIRLGYLSGDFHDHATVVLIAETIERHDRSAFTVQGYSYGPDDGSPMRARLARAFDSFVDLAHLGDDAAADRIRADGIDILIDLKGYTTGARPQIVALRPAPVQVNWLGFPGTMGSDFIDVALADATTAPSTLDRHCTERIVRLPGCFQPTDTTRPIGETLPRADYGLPEHGFVFCCFNNSYKITPDVFGVWMRLLARVDGSALWLLDTGAEARANLVREAASAGLDPSRLVFAPRRPMAEHLARHRAADLFLDTQPVNALTTASDALWAGLPVLTCLGATVSGRGCASLVRAAGLPELVMPDMARYEAVALHLARVPDRLAAVRERLAGARGTASLFNTPLFVMGLEAALRSIIDEASARDVALPHAPDDFDHLSDAWAVDASAVWAGLRGGCPVARTYRYGGLAMLTRYEDVRAAAYDTGRFSPVQIGPRIDSAGAAPPADHAMPTVIDDPPHHRDDRIHLIAALSPREVGRFASEAQALARRLLATLPQAGDVDAARDYAWPLALHGVGRMLGLRDADMARVGERVRAASSTTPDASAEVDVAIADLRHVADAEVRHRVDTPGEDVLSHLLSQRIDGRLIPLPRVAEMLRTLLLAGIDTTAGTLGSALLHLAHHPALARRLRDAPDLLAEAVEEFLRLASPATPVRRIERATNLRGCPLSAGSLVLLPFGAANRDPDAFPDPDELVFGRPASPPHLAFGAGIHSCVGRHLARLLVTTGLREWLATVPAVRLGATAPVWSTGLVRGLRSLPLIVERGAARPAEPSRPDHPQRRDSGALHGTIRLDLGGHPAAVFVRAFNMREARRTLICLHGFVSDGRDYLPLAAEAARRGYRVLCPDWPGRGRSDRLPPERYTTATYDAVLRSCWAASAGGVSVVASSFGAFAALGFLARSGTGFDTTVLVDPVLQGGPDYDALSRAVVGGGWDLFPDLDGFGHRFADLFPSVRLLEDEALRAYLLARAERVGVDYRMNCDPALVAGFGSAVGLRFDDTGLLARLNGRVAVVYGERSPFGTVDVQVGIAAVRPDATVVADFPGAHPPLLRSAGEVERLLRLLDATAA